MFVRVVIENDQHDVLVITPESGERTEVHAGESAEMPDLFSLRIINHRGTYREEGVVGLTRDEVRALMKRMREWLFQGFRVEYEESIRPG